MLRVLVVALLLFSQSVVAEIYQWVDEQGRVQFSDKAPAGQQVDTVDAREPNAMQAVAVSEPSAAGSPNLIMYSTDWCGYCKKARQYFRANNIPFQELDIEKSERANRAYKKLGGKTVPLLVMGKKTMAGFNVQRFEQFYKSAKTEG